MNKLYLAAFIGLLSACGGSSSGGSGTDLAPEVVVQPSEQSQNLLLNQNFSLDASQSRDPEGQNLSYHWVVLSQPTGSTLSESNNSYYEFAPQLAGNYQLQLVVSDGNNSQVRDFDYQTVSQRITLNANTSTSQSAAEQVEAVFGANSVELPETHAAEHLEISNDTLAGAHFVCTLHLEEDGDRSTSIDQTDRQRCEIVGRTVETRCSEGERMAISWRFKADDLGLSTSFTHLFQMKGQASHPLLTLTAKRTAGVEALRVNYGDSDQVLAEVDWSEVNDRWLEAQMTVGCGSSGGLSLTVKDLATDETQLQVNQPNLDMWQGVNGDEFGFKFGLYRKVKANIGDTEFRTGLIPGASSARFGNINIETF